MFDRFSNRLTVSGTLVTETALRVGTGRSSEPIGAELPVLRDAYGRPLIPGASFKGVFRAYVESLVRAVTDHSLGACMPTGDHLCLDQDDMKTLKERANGDEKKLAKKVWKRSCLICRTFGSTWLASHVWISDLPVDEATWFGQFQVRDGVGIDRDTGTVAQGLLYNYEVVPAGTRFHCQLAAENLKKWQLGMLWMAVQRLVRGEMSIGGFHTRGLGQVRLEDAEARYFKLGPEGGRASRLIDYVVAETAGEPVEAEKARKWVAKFKAKVAELAEEEAKDA